MPEQSIADPPSAFLILVVPPGFEPGSPGPKPEMMDHYTTGLRPVLNAVALVFDGTVSRQYQAIFFLP